MRPVRKRLRAIAVHGQRIVCGIRTFGNLDDVLRTQSPDDGILTAGGAEQDAVCRRQVRDIDRVVALRTIDRDGIEIQARRIEVADRENLVVPRAGIDDDFLDIVELGNHVVVGRPVPRDDDLGIGVQRPVAAEGLPVRTGIDTVGFVLVVAVDDEGIVCASTAIDNVSAVTDNDSEQPGLRTVQEITSSPAVPVIVSFRIGVLAMTLPTTPVGTEFNVVSAPLPSV